MHLVKYLDPTSKLRRAGLKVFMLLALAAAEKPSTGATSSKDCAAKTENDVHTLMQVRLQVGADNLTASSLQTSSASKPAAPDKDLSSKVGWQCYDHSEFGTADELKDDGSLLDLWDDCSNFGFGNMQACRDRCAKVNQCRWAIYNRKWSRYDCPKPRGYCAMRDGSRGRLEWRSSKMQACMKPPTKACGEGDVMTANVFGEQTLYGPNREFVPWVWHSGEWYPICGHYFWDNHYGATIVCRALGFTWGTSRVVRDKYSKQAMGVGRCTCSGRFQAERACAGKTLTTCAGDWGNFCWGGCNKCSPGAAVGVRVQCTGGPGHAASCQTCFESNTLYTPINMNGQGRSVESGASACQQRCASVSGCAHFSIYGDGGCHLQSSDASPQTSSGTTAGPPSCVQAGIVDTCKPKSTSNQDQGYNDLFRGWYDIQGCGKCYDYCRWVGSSGSGGDPSIRVTHGSSWWSCRLAGGSAAYTARNHITPWQFSNIFSKCAGEGAAAP